MGTLSMSELAARVKEALEADDLTAYSDLLDPHATWGAPDDEVWGCHSRKEILAWYGQARDAGVRASVTEVVEGTDKLLVGLRVWGRDDADESGDALERWQVLTIRDGLVSDIRGFEDRETAAARAGVEA